MVLMQWKVMADADAFFDSVSYMSTIKDSVGDADVADITIDRTFIYLRVLHFGD